MNAEEFLKDYFGTDDFILKVHIASHTETLDLQDIYEVMEAYKLSTTKVSDEEILLKAREVGAKFGKTSELDFGAGAEWMRRKLKQ